LRKRTSASSLHFRASTVGNNRFGLPELCEQYINELWLPDHLLPDQTAGSALDRFKRAVMNDLAMLSVEADEAIA